MSDDPGVSVLAPRNRFVPLLAFLFALLLTLPAAPVVALHGNADPSVVLCGTVENAAGWPLEGVRVTAIGRGVTNVDHLPSPSNTTDANGTFRLVILADFYRVVIQDPEGRDLRAGAIYQPTGFEIGGHTYDDGPCDADQGIELDPIVLEAPQQGFIEFALTGAIDEAPLAEGTVEARLLGTHAWGGATSDADGIARLSCPLHVPVTLHASAPDHGATEVETTCTASVQDGGASLWRTPVAVTGTLGDDSTGEAVDGATVIATPQTLVLPQGHPYVLQATSGPAGYALALPWTDGYDATIERGGYAPRAFAFNVTADDIAAGLDHSFILERATATFTGTVTDIAGAGLGATIRVTGPAPATDVETIVAGPDGTFSAGLPVGDYDVEIEAPGKNDRSCSLVLAYDANASLTQGCLVLVTEGKGAVLGTVRDGLTGLTLPDVAVSVDDASTTSAADGSFAFEVAPTNGTITFSRQHFETTSRSIDITLDEVVVLSDEALGRETVAKVVHVRDAENGTSVEGATVCPVFVPAAGEPVAHTCAESDAAGEARFQLQWTAISGDYDTGDYLFTGERTSAVPFFANETCLTAVDIDLSDLATPSTCELAPVPALVTSVGPFVDAHDGASIAAVQVATTLPALPCGAPYDCDVTTGANGTADLLLPAGFAFGLAARHDDYGVIVVADDVLAGTGAFIDTALIRDHYSVFVSVSDAHTGLPLSGVTVDADATFVCAPQAIFSCSTETDGSGVAELVLPWGELSLNVPDGTFDVVRDAAFDDIEAGVGFYGTALGTITVPGVAEVDAALLRTPADPLVVDVSAFDGALVADAILTVGSERFGTFTCDPAENAGREPGYAVCGASLDASSGALTLTLPNGTADDHTWQLRVQAPDHFREDRFGVADAAPVEIALWPLTFDLVVDPVDMTDQESAPLVVVCIRNLDALATSPSSPPTETCKSSGVTPQPLVFEDVTWRRTAGDDTTDRFMVRAAGTFHFPSTTVVSAGPAAPSTQVALVPVDPTVPEPEASVIPGRVVDRDAKALAPGDGVGVVGAHVVAVAANGCLLGSFESASGLDGSFQVPVLCHGEYDVSVADGRYAAPAPEPVTAPTATPLLFTLDRVTRTVTVTVQDVTTAAPVPDASVALTGLDVEASASGLTGSDGTVAFDLPWGSYALAASGPDETGWTLGDAANVIVVSHASDAGSEVLLVSEPSLPGADACAADDDLPDLCGPASDDGQVRLMSVGASGGDGQPLAGNWLVLPPQLGTGPLVGVGSGVSPGQYDGPHGGTWTVLYTPPSMAGLTGVPSYPIEVRLAYTVDGEDRTVTATLQEPVVGPSPFVSPSLSWAVNLHTGRSIACAGPMVTCDGAPADLAEAQAARFFTP